MREAYYEAAIADEIHKVTRARPGARNTMLNNAAFALASLGIPEHRIRSVLTSAAEQCGLVQDSGPKAVRATIASGMRAGYANPRQTLHWENSFGGYRPQPSPSPNKPTHATAKTQASPSEPTPSQFSGRRIQIPPRSTPDKDGKPKFIIAGDEGPPHWDNEIRRHVYRRDGFPVRIKLKYQDKSTGKTAWASWYRVHDRSTLGWQAGKPEGYRDPPYLTFGSNPFDPEAQSDVLYWPEGEKDVDNITKLGGLAFTFGGAGDGLPENADIVRYLSGWDVVILADNDDGGRDHAQRKAAVAHAVAKSVKITEFPELPEHGDISDWLGQGRTAEELHARADAAPLWSPPSPSATSDDEQTKQANALIDELAQLSGLDYARRRRAAARDLGIKVGDLEREVRARREAIAAERGAPPLFGHWVVEPWPEPVDADALIVALVRRIRRHVVLTLYEAVTVALWILMAWVHHETAIHSPILLATSAEANSGKTTLLNVVSFLVPRGMSCVGTSEASLFRSVEMWTPTIIVDEADTILVENEPLRAVINSGYTRGSGVLRCIGDDNTPHLFMTFCPKALGMKGRKLPDTTLSRCTIIEMRRKKNTERAEHFKHIDDENLGELRSQCMRFAIDSVEALKVAKPEMPDGFDNRAGDNWTLMIAIADHAGGEWPEKARQAAIVVSKVVAAAESSIGVRLLADIKVLFDEADDNCMLSKVLVAKLTANEEGPWIEFSRDKPLTQNRLAKLLGRYFIYSETVHPKVGPHGKGYKRASFEDGWARYPSDTPSDTPPSPSSGADSSSQRIEI
jgi:hypothetical protein